MGGVVVLAVAKYRVVGDHCGLLLLTLSTICSAVVTRIRMIKTGSHSPGSDIVALVLVLERIASIAEQICVECLLAATSSWLWG